MNKITKLSIPSIRLGHNLTKLFLNENNLNQIEIVNKENLLELVINEDNHKNVLKFNPHWLRFNCQSLSSRQPNTGQRTVSIDKIPKDLKIKEVIRADDKLYIRWDDSSQQKDSIFSIEYLIKNYPSYEEVKQTKSYSNYEPCHDLKYVNYSDLVDEFGNKNELKIFEWLKIVAKNGLCIVKNLPTKDKMIKNLAELIAPLQRTIYGELFDVKVDKDPINLAFSNAMLDFHQDLVYYETPPGIQFLHCLKYDPAIIGGETLFVDSFEIAENFRNQHPKLFDVLTKIPATFHKLHNDKGKQVIILQHKPHIILNHRGSIIGVNWGPANEGPLTNLSPEEIKSYYEAYLEFYNAINNSSKIIAYRLEPGDVACFNNRRILHSRKAFIQSNGLRHFQGCYINIDEFKSELLAKEHKLNVTSKSGLDLNKLELKNLMVGNHDYI